MYSFPKDQLPAIQRILKDYRGIPSPIPGEILLSKEEVDQLQGAYQVGSRGKSEYDGVVLATVQAGNDPLVTAGGEPDLKVISWDGNFPQDKFVALVRQIVMPAMPKKRIVISVPHGKAKPMVVKEEKFSIHLWSSPCEANGNEYKVPKQAWGNNICQDSNGLGIPTAYDLDPIYAPEGLVASVNECNLYVHFDLMEWGDEKSFVVAKRLLQEAVSVLSLRGDFASNVKAHKENYIRLAKVRADQEKQEIIERIEQIKAKIEDSRRTLLQLAPKLQQELNLLTMFDTGSDELASKLSREWDNILRVPRVTKVVCSADALRVHTDTIYVKNKSKFFKIGKFAISITRDGKVRFVNLDGRVVAYNGMKMQAPHVFPDGAACWGNLEATITELFERQEYAAIVQMAIAFLSTANTSDPAGSYLTRWPEVTEAEATKISKKAEPEKKGPNDGKARSGRGKATAGVATPAN